MTDYQSFVEDHNTKLTNMLDKQFEQLLKNAAKNLKNHEDFKSYTMGDLVNMMKGGEPVSAKKTKKTTKAEPKKKAESKTKDLPDGLTEARWSKIQEAAIDLSDNEKVNVKTGKAVKMTKRNEHYYKRGSFCGPAELKKVVLWCNRNHAEVEDADETVEIEDEESEIEFEQLSDDEDSSSEDQPPRRNKKNKNKKSDEDDDEESSSDEEPPKRKSKKSNEDDEDDEDEDDEDEDDEDESSSEDEPPKRKNNKSNKSKEKVDDSENVLASTTNGSDFTMKDLKALKKAAEKAVSKGGHVNAETRRPCAKNDKNKKTFVFYKAGYSVPKSNEDLQDAIKANW